MNLTVDIKDENRTVDVSIVRTETVQLGLLNYNQSYFKTSPEEKEEGES